MEEVNSVVMEINELKPQNEPYVYENCIKFPFTVIKDEVSFLKTNYKKILRLTQSWRKAATSYLREIW